MSLDTLNAEIKECKLCPRLVAWREEVARVKRRAYLDWEYWGRPVPGFGDPNAQILVVGLAPGAHGSNRTGRMFTGDASGDFLYPALYRAGFASQPTSVRKNDGLTLHDLYITAVCKCVPPQNKPTTDELVNCQSYLIREIELGKPYVYVALGKIAFSQLLKHLSIDANDVPFSHGVVNHLKDGSWLLGSYHPSRQNTQTGRLTREMFDNIWMQAKSLIDE